MNTFYPAIFCKEDIGYSVRVPDIDGCVSQGDTLDEACHYIKEAIGLCLEGVETLPAASDINTIECEKDEFLVLVEFDMLEYKKRHENKAVKKTLTIPFWLNEEAERQHINFSSVLQSALKQRLGV